MFSRRTIIARLLTISAAQFTFSKGLNAASRRTASTIHLEKADAGMHGFYFGWVRDLPHENIQLYEAPLAITQALPNSVDLRSLMPDVYDQKQIGSCSANAIAAAVQFIRRKNNQLPDFPPSRLFIYYNGRTLEGSVPLDSGLQLTDGITSIVRYGVCAETEWPYDPTPANPHTHLFPPTSRAVQLPSSTTYNDAYPHRAISAWRVTQRAEELKGCLAEGYPFVFGFRVYENFFDLDTGRPRVKIPVPGPTDKPTPFGHAVVAVGYDDSTQLFTCRNSWGVKDGLGREVQDKGHFYMPYAYLQNPNLAADFWTIRMVLTLK